MAADDTPVLGLRHRTIHDFSSVVGGRRLWTCSGCDRVDWWGDSWARWSTIECIRSKGCGRPRGCGHERMYWVACSEECMAKMPDHLKGED